MKRLVTGALASAFLAFAAATAAAADRPYAEGPVLQLSYIKILPGQFDNYMKYLSTTWKQLMEEYKKQGIILDYAVYGAQPRSPAEPDLILVQTFRNFAALDGMQDKTEGIDARVFGSLEKANQASIDRGKMRESLGGEVIRQLVLK